MSHPDKRVPVSAQRLWSHHRVLCREIGPRLLGTEADRRAAGYIEAHLDRCGYETRRQEFPCPSWEHRSTLIRNAGGFEVSPPDGGACMFSAPCDVKGELAVVSGLDELHAASLEGKICLVTPDGELSGTDFRSGDSPVQALFAEKSPLALLVVDRRENTYNTKTVRNPDFEVPVCALSASAGARLAREGGEVSVRIDARRFPGRTGNVFGRLPARGRPVTRVFAHYDTTSDSPGSKDNASGTAVMLEMAEALTLGGLDLPVEFIAFGAEEYGCLGSKEYARCHPGEAAETFLAINIDSVGCCGTEPVIYSTGQLPEADASLRARAAAAGGYHRLSFGEVPVASDDVQFRRLGVPVIFAHDSQAVYLHHSPLDIPRFMCLERLEDIARILLGVLVDTGCRPSSARAGR